MNRRDLLKTGLVAGAALSLPTTVAAAPQRGSKRDRFLFDIAKRELDRAGDAIWKRDIVGIADFGVHSANHRCICLGLRRPFLFGINAQVRHLKPGMGNRIGNVKKEGLAMICANEVQCMSGE